MLLGRLSPPGRTGEIHELTQGLSFYRVFILCPNTSLKNGIVITG